MTSDSTVTVTVTFINRFSLTRVYSPSAPGQNGNASFTVHVDGTLVPEGTQIDVDADVEIRATIGSSGSYRVQKMRIAESASSNYYELFPADADENGYYTFKMPSYSTTVTMYVVRYYAITETSNGGTPETGGIYSVPTTVDSGDTFAVVVTLADNWKVNVTATNANAGVPPSVTTENIVTYNFIKPTGNNNPVAVTVTFTPMIAKEIIGSGTFELRDAQTGGSIIDSRPSNSTVYIRNITVITGSGYTGYTITSVYKTGDPIKRRYPVRIGHPGVIILQCPTIRLLSKCRSIPTSLKIQMVLVHSPCHRRHYRVVLLTYQQ